MNKINFLEKLRHALKRETLINTARKPRVKKTGITLLSLFVLIVLTLFFAGPPLLKSYLTEKLSQQLGRKVSVGKISVNPFELSATIENFKLAEPDGQTTFVAFRELYVNAQLASIAFLGPVLREIRLTQPQVHLVRDKDERYNFQDILDKLDAAQKAEKSAKPAPAKAEENGKQPSFSLNNIQIIGGQIDFDDQPKQRKHQVRDLRVLIPFLSNLFYRVDDFVQPEFSANINGARFALTGQSKPFEEDRESNLQIKLDQLQLGLYLRYVPKKLNFTLPSGTLDADVKLAFQQPAQKAPTLSLSGKVVVNNLDLQEAKDVPTIALKQLVVQLRSIEPLTKRFAIDSITAKEGSLHVRRDRQGRLNLANLVEPDNSNEPLPWFEIRQTNVDGIALHVRDESVPRPFDTTLQLEHLAANNIGSGKEHQGKVELTASGPDATKLQAQTAVQLQPLLVQGNIALEGFPIKALAAYYEPLLDLQITQGNAGFATQFLVSQAGKDAPLDIKLSALSTSIDKLKARLSQEKSDLLQLGKASLSGGTIDLGKQNIGIGEIALQDAQLNVLRDKRGNLNLNRIVRESKDKTKPADKAPAWQYVVDKISLANGSVRVRDESLPTETAKLELNHIQALVEQLSSATKSSAKVKFDAQMGRGRIALDGKVVPQIQAANLQVQLRNVPMLPAQPYFSNKVRITLTSGTLSALGKLDAEFAGEPKVRYTGNMQINQFASVDQVNKNDFLKWDSLNFNGVQITTAPLKIAMDEIALSNFYSRLIVNPDGKLNVQHIVGGSAQAAAGEDDTSAKAKEKEITPTPTTTAPPAPATPIRIGRVVLQGGQVNFSDRFIKPNYSANLTNIGGRISGLSSDLATTADVEVRGQVDNAAPLEILGKVNPLSGNLFLDLSASAKGIDLPGVTPYSARYAGYPILKGKLSVDVKYHIKNQKLEAQNHIVLDQLTFGERVDSPDATKLPVLLAVALLKDRNGVIDINLPIGGSLNDPDFSVGGIIVRVIVNLIAKAITSPFALLGSLFPNSEQLAYIEFVEGRATLDAAALSKMQNLAQALEQRPGLKLDITGRVDPQLDKEGLRRTSIERKVKAVKFETLRKEGKAPVSLDEITVDRAEYPKLLKEAYSREKFDKPRNIIGLAKDLPVPEMEKLMLANAIVSDDDLRQLALRRARAVADALSKTGKVANERVFVLEPKLTAEQPKDSKEKLKNSRVDFSLK